MDKKITIIALVLFCSLVSLAQNTFTSESLGEGVNTSYPEINPMLSPDGKTLYFTRANHPQNTWGEDKNQDVWYSTLNDDGTWSSAVRMPETVNIGRYNAIYGIINNGNTLVINGRYSSGIFSKSARMWIERGMSMVNRNADGTWSEPIPIKIKRYSSINRGETSTAYMTPDGQYIFMAFSKSLVGLKNRLFVSKRIGERRYSKPKPLKFEDSDNFSSSDAPFLSDDGNALYFGANIGEKYCIYVCYRSDDTYTKWTKPFVLSDNINTSTWQSYYRLNKKGSWAYYSISDEMDRMDIYRVKLFEENPYIKVTGSILNKKDMSAMLTDTTYRIAIDGGAPLVFKINRNTASYELRLPFGSKYSIKPKLDGWIGVDSEYDATSAKEYAEVKQDILFEPIPFVKVKGKFINSRTDALLHAELKPVVLINNQQSDSVRYDRANCSYEATLPLGAQYNITTKLPNYSAKGDAIDARNLTSFLEKEINFNFVSAPYVEVRGVALDNVTFTPILGEAKPKLMIDGRAVDSVLIHSLTGEYVVRLPFGKKYRTAVSSATFKVVENELDLTSHQEFAVVKHDVYGENKFANMATLTGKIINLKTGQPLEANVPAKMKVNGTETLGFKYDSISANFSLKLTVGSVYDIMPSVRNFYNKYEQVDLTMVKKGAQVPKNFYVTPIEIGQSVNIDFIYFETGKATLKPASFRSLSALVDFLKEYPNVMVEIGGHTDNVGAVAINQRISEQRAKAVAEFVLSMGIDPARITSKGYNFEKPKESNKTEKGRAANRRVEFTIVGI